jgi:hypothetical protein
VLNGPRNGENRLAIEEFGCVQIVSEIEPLSALSPENLLRASRGFDRKALLESFLKSA